MRSLEIGSYGFEPQIDPSMQEGKRKDLLLRALKVPKADRLWFIADAFREGMSVEEVNKHTGIEPWFLAQIEELIQIESDIAASQLDSMDAATLFSYKQKGFSDVRLSVLLNVSEAQVRDKRHALDVRPVYKRVDSCAAEFATATAYMYSSYEQECESDVQPSKKVIVLGGGPNRIGQGIEFDYCCVHASMALQEDGFQTIMVNCNPETVSTDYDTSDRLYFEPLTLEDVNEIIALESPDGVIVQYGGQTPLKLARPLQELGAKVIGTSPEAIHNAEDREHFQSLLNRLELKQPPNRIASAEEEALELADEVGYPLVVRPSYVLGGRAMEIVHDRQGLKNYMGSAIQVSNDSPVLLDRFLNDAIEVDVDAICDGESVVIGGIMEHIEEAGVHSGDSACSLPPFSLDDATIESLREQTAKMALELNVVGLMNVQFAIQGDNIYVLEVNPRASRTVPFVSKATARPLAKIAAKCMAGRTLDDLGVTDQLESKYYSVKEAVFPFVKFPGVDTILGPEMKSTGEVMGVGESFGEAFSKAQQGAGAEIPLSGNVLFSVRDADKDIAAEVASYLSQNGFKVYATAGTARFFEERGIEVKLVNKVLEGRPHIVDMIIDGRADMVINTTSTTESLSDSYTIRREALMHKVTYYTNIAAARAAAQAHKAHTELRVNKLQDLHAQAV
jgi:carbamoyl-phosphate synthase large subunit